MQLAVGTFGRVRHALLQFLGALLVTTAQFRGPLPVHPGLAVAGLFDHGAQGFGGRGEDFDGAAAVVAHLRRRIADADEFCALTNTAGDP